MLVLKCKNSQNCTYEVLELRRRAENKRGKKERRKRKKKKPQLQNVMSASTMQGGHKYGS